MENSRQSYIHITCLTQRTVTAENSPAPRIFHQLLLFGCADCGRCPGTGIGGGIAEVEKNVVATCRMSGAALLFF